MIPTPKYAIGQKVYSANGHYGQTDVKCPDCLGEKEWTASTPAGEVFQIPCSTCEHGYFSRGVIVEYGPVTDTREVTIGSVRIDTEDEKPVSYMCEETGVGSGRVWYEDELFTEQNHALTAARFKAAKATAEIRKRQADQIAKEKLQAKRKPSWEARRIKELEKQLRELQKEPA